MIDININTPALLFPAITLLMLAYTNRFLALGTLVRKLHDEYKRGEKEDNLLRQIKNLRSRLNLIRYMQGLGVISFLCCVLCMYIIFRGWLQLAHVVFAASLLFLLASIILSLLEINKSTKAIELVKSLGLTQQEVTRLNKNTYKILGLELTKVKRIRSISFIQGTLVNTLRQVILFILMWLIFRGDMDAGQLVTMQIFSFFVFGPLQEIGNILLSYREAEASLNNFHALMQKEPEPEPAYPKPLGNIETLSFSQVSFKHQN